MVSGEDGLPIRESGPWAREKLVYVEKYQHIFATGMKKWSDRVYLDLLAGPGRCIDRDTGDEFAGSPVLSLAAPFTARVLVEADAGLAQALRRRVGPDAFILNRDCNQASTIVEMRRHLGLNALGLAFIDNVGLDVAFHTLSTLTADRRVDLMITFQVSDLTRNIGNVMQGREDRERFDAFFGSQGWVDVVNVADARNASSAEKANDLLDFYAKRLGTIGYAHVEHSQVVMKNSRNAAQYRRLLAGKHVRAVEFFRKIALIDPTGQRRLY